MTENNVMFTAFYWRDWINPSGYAALSLWHVAAVRSTLLASNECS